MNHRILEYLRIGNYKCISESTTIGLLSCIHMKLDFHIALIILYVIDCTHSSEHDNDH